MAIVAGDDLLKVLQRLEDVLVADAAGTSVTIANAADVTQGGLADLPVGDDAGSVNAHLRHIAKTLLSMTSVLPLPTAASTAAKQDVQHADLAAILAALAAVSVRGDQGVVLSTGSTLEYSGVLRVMLSNNYGLVYPPLTLGDGDTLQHGLPAGGYVYHGNGTWDRLRTPIVFVPLNAVSVNAEATIWTPASGKKFRLMGYHLAGSLAGNIVLRDNTSGTIIVVIPSAAGGGGSVADLGNGILSATADNVLTAQGPLTATLSGMVWGTVE